MYNKMS